MNFSTEIKEIDEAEYQSLNKMYDSPDRENRTVAVKVINNLSND